MAPSREVTLAAEPAAQASAGPPTAEMVAARAYQIYLEEGRPEGRQLDHWTRAEAELLHN